MIQSATSYIDIAQLVLYAFWIFFAGLIFYLHRENKREGYPLETERGSGSRLIVRGFPDLPGKKVFHNHDGKTFTVPLYRNDRGDAPVTPSAEWPGSPFVPTGNPMLDGVGPASYANREDAPELGIEGHPILQPLRIATRHSIATEGPNPIGMKVYAADGVVAGTVTDAWIDEAESIVRYLEVDIGTRTVLLPKAMARVSNAKGVRVASILAAQFADVPALANPDQVTKLEEDKIAGYFCGGHLYATPDRFGPLL
jgi:photosynthetic reaction center H subunit